MIVELKGMLACHLRLLTNILLVVKISDYLDAESNNT